jgi:ABC-type glycerol-3-phosphate transport system substrate-binding protein
MSASRATRIARVVIASGAILATAVALSGCGTKTGGGSTASSAANTTLTYWSTWSKGEPQQKIFADIITDFTKSTGVKVEVKWLGRDGLATIENALAVGDGPDIYDSGTDHIAEYRSKKDVGSLTAVLNDTIPGEDKKVKDVLSSSVISASSDSTGLGLIPHTIISTGMWFDAAANPQYVTTPPATFDDFLAEAKKIKAGGQAPIAQDGNINFYNAYWFYWLQMRNGGPGTLSALGGDASAWDDPSVLASAQDVQKLVDAGLFEKDYMGTEYPAAQNAWASGKNTFELNGSWLSSETAKTAKSGFEPETFPFPSVPGGHDSVDVGTLGWSIAAQSKNATEAGKFLAFSLQDKYITRISTEALNIPARSDVKAPAALQTLADSINSATEVNKTYDEAPALHSGWWNDVFLPLDDKLIAGKITANQFVTDGKKQTADYIANN